MRLYNFRIILALVFAILVVSSFPCAAVGVKFVSSGIYTDGSGGQHAWKVNDSHTLLWDGDPYIPVGGVFASRYLSIEASDENYQADVTALETIKSKGITDIILKSTKPMTVTDPAAWQKMVDYLDKNGFTYGVAIDDGPKEPLSGYIIAPGLFRLEGPSSETAVVVDWPGLDSAVFAIARSFDNSIRATGGGVVKDGKLTINLPNGLAAGEVLVVYPRRTFKSAADGGMGDIWTGFGEYRDRLLAFMKQIKFGPGLHFFLEPFTSKMDFTGEMSGFLPDSAGFRLGLEAYLTQRYIHEGGVNTAWGLRDNLDSVETAARLMPLWGQGRGLAYAYDRASATMYAVDASVAQAWNDITLYRDNSTRQFMNTISDALKKQIADVPVIFKSDKHHAVYQNPYRTGGSDGIGAVAYGTGETPVSTAAGPVYALAEESAKTTWYIAAGTASASDVKTLVGYPNEVTMAATMDCLREVGCKGFFVDSLQALPDDTRGNFSLLKAPEQLDWLKAFKDKVDKKSWVDFKPDVVYYPTSPLTGACVKRLARNTWWLPTLRSGSTTFIGDGLYAYALANEDKSVIWSGSGTRVITLQNSTKSLPGVEFPGNVRIDGKKDGTFAIELGETPVVLRGMNLGLTFPYETANAEIAKLTKLIPEADKLGLDVKKARQTLEDAKDPLRNKLPMTAYGMVQTAYGDLIRLMGSDLWLEGEECAAQNFNGPTSAPGASGGVVLVLDAKNNAPMSSYSATFRLTADANSSYEIWIAATPPTEGSPMSYSIDDTGFSPVAAVDGTVQPYAPGLAWYKIGTANLVPGNHTIKIKADGRRSQDNRYYFAIDALVLSPRGFKPDGVNKPF